jgi:hypothetical protein
MSLSTKCPACGKVLKLKSEAAVGRKVPCPDCHEPFVVKLRSAPQKPTPVEDEYGADEYGTEDYGGYDYDEEDYDDGAGYDEYEAPARSARQGGDSSPSRKTSRKKKKQAAAAWLKPLLIGGGALLGLGLVATVITFSISSLGGSSASNVVDLSYQPENCDTFMIIRPAAMANSPLSAAMGELPMVKQFMEMQQQQTGTAKFADFDLVVVGLTGISEQPQLSLFGRPVGSPSAKPDPKPLIVCRMARDISTDELKNYVAMSGSAASGDIAEKQHSGKTYYEATTPKGMFGVWQPDQRTLVMGTSDMVTAAIDRGSVEPRIARLDFVDASQHFVMVHAPAAIAPSTNTSGSPGSVAQRLEGAFGQNVRAAAFGFTLSSDIDLTVRTVCYGSSEATDFKTAIDTSVAEGRTKAEIGLASVPPGMESLVAVAKETLGSIQSHTSGDNVDLTMKVPGKLVDAIKAVIDANPMASMMIDMALKQAAAAQGQVTAQQAFPGQSPGASPGLSPGLTPQEAAIAVQSKNNLKQIGRAMHDYHDAFKRFPNAVSPEDTDQPLLSWRVQLLPYLDQVELFRKFHMNEPWDSPHNLPLAAEMPDIFRIPGSSVEDGQTCYVALRGPGTAFSTDGKATRLRDIMDGSSNTIMIVEAGPQSAVAWTRPDDLNFDPAKPREGLFGMRPAGFLAVLCDGTVLTVRNALDDETLRRFAIRNDKQIIDPAAF